MDKKWYILILAALTATIAVAAQAISLTVLFEEISSDLNLSLVQVGFIWGMSSLPGVFTSLLGGAVGDRLGPKRVVLVGTLLLGISGAARGLSTDFYSLGLTVFLSGMLTPILILSFYKTIGTWFPRQQLGLAAGIFSMGMALGFLLGSLLSATFLSPWLGGWRNVMFFYGALSILLCVFWILTPSAPGGDSQHKAEIATVPMLQAIRHVASIKNAWLLGFALFGYSGSVQAALGYLPLHLRATGWTDVGADTAISSFHLASMLLVIPIAYLSDRLGQRKKMLGVMGLMTAAGLGLLTIAQGPLVWAAIILAGMVRDGFMALFMTMTIETDNVGALYAGTATGFVLVFSSLGNFLAPPLGNSLAQFSPVLPFAAWAILAAAGIFCLAQTRSAS